MRSLRNDPTDPRRDRPKVIVMPPKTYRAKLSQVGFDDCKVFKIAGTLDGFIDFAVPDGPTFPLDIEEAQGIIAALQDAIADIAKNCLYEKDYLKE